MKLTFSEKILSFTNYFLLILFGLSCLLPLVHIAALSFSDDSSIMSGFVGLWPQGFNTQSYEYLFKGTRLVQAFSNSIELTLVGTSLSLLCTILGAYPLTRSYMVGKRFFTLAILFTMIFSGGIIPTYLVMKNLHLIDSYWALWLNGLVSPWNLLILMSFFRQIPSELIDAAQIDGCNEFRTLRSIMIPLSLPVLATLAVFYGIGNWNNFNGVLIYINNPEKFNLAVFVNEVIRPLDLSKITPENILDLNDRSQMQITAESVKSASIFVMILPILCVYPFLQKYFVKGTLMGSIKG